MSRFKNSEKPSARDFGPKHTVFLNTPPLIIATRAWPSAAIDGGFLFGMMHIIAGWRGGLKILLERVLDQKHRIERGFPSIFDHYRHHSYTGDG